MAQDTLKAEVKSAAPVREEQLPLAVEVRPARSSLLARLLPHLLVLAAMLVVTVVATWPMLPSLGGYVVSKLDPLYTIWAMAWQAHALATNPLGLFDTNIMYPFKGTLAFDELAFAEAVISAPLYWLTGNPILSHNAQWLLTFVLSGYGMWLLVRELTRNNLAALVGGACFAFSFYRFNHLPHTTLLSAEWMPFLLLAAYKLWWTRSWKWAAALGVFFTLQSLSSHYLAFYSAILMGLFVGYYALADRGRLSLAFLGKGAAALFVSLLAMLPIMIPYVTVQSGQEFTRGVFETERYSNTLASFLAIYEGNPLYRALFAPFADPGPWPWERAAFPGLVVLVLALIALVGARRVEPPEAPSEPPGRPRLAVHAYFFGIVVLVSAFLSLGPTLQLTYAPSSYDPNAVNGIIPLPYAFLHDWVPGFKSMRVVARIDVLVSLSLAVMAGIGALVLLRWFRSKLPAPQARWALPAVAGVLALLPVAETWSAPLSLDAIGTRDAVPPVYRWLAEQPPTVILEYPMTLDPSRRGDENVAMANTYQYYSAYNWQREVNASTTIRPDAYSALVLETQDCFPCPRSLDVLWTLGVRYVVVHMDNLTQAEKTDFLWRSTNPVAKVVNDFKLVKEFGSDRVYQLEPRPVGQIADYISPGASVLLGDPQLDPIKVGTDTHLIGGGYMASLGYFLKDHPLYGDSRLGFGEPISPPDPNNLADYAVLWANQDPNTAGYLEQNRVWANEFVAVYKRGPAHASVGSGR